MFLKKINKKEIPLLILLFSVSIFLNVLYLHKFYGVFFPIISGYDPYLLSTLTDWSHTQYLHSSSLFSHPGFAIITLPFAVLNTLVSFFIGTNCANFILSITLTLMYVASVIFLKKILEELVYLKPHEALILSLLFGSMAYVLIMSFTPDHFAFSQFFLILYTYLWTKNKSKETQKKSLFFTYIIICGITITNGIKILLSLLFFKRGRGFLKYSLLSIIILAVTTLIPRILTIGIDYSRNNTDITYLAKKYVNSINNKHFYSDEKEIEGKYHVIKPDCSPKQNESNKQLKEQKVSITGNFLFYKLRGIFLEYMVWTGETVSRFDAFVYNMFGESSILHKNSINKDGIGFVSYSNIFINVVNYIFILMVFCGIYIGRKTPLMKLLTIFLSTDILLHIIIGFGINEVHIFSPHYLFIYVISIGYLIKNTTGYWRTGILSFIFLTFVVVSVNNILEIYRYLG